MPASKAVKHKERNKHRFLTFSERLSQVSVDAVHRIVRTDEAEGENVSKFRESLMKWRDQDKSLPFREFFDEVQSKSKNYRMVVHYRNEILQSLQKHIATPDSLALESLCELLVALCMDLRSELYPFFPEIFRILTKLLETKDLQRLEWIFSAISLLFKYLWRYMINDIENILSLYSDIICGDHPAHIATFAAESMSFLLRKVLMQKDIFLHLLKMFDGEERAYDGVAKIIFYILKSTKGKLHSCAEKFLPILLSIVTDAESTSSSFGFECLKIVFRMVADHIEKDNAATVWKILLDHLENLPHQNKSFGSNVSKLLDLFDIWCKYKCGILIVDSKAVIDTVEVLFNHQLVGEFSSNLLEVCESLLMAHKGNVDLVLKENLLKKIISVRDISWPTMVVFWRKIFSMLSTHMFAKLAFLKYCQTQIQVEKLQSDTVALLTEYLLSDTEQPKDGKDLESYSPTELNFAVISRKKGLIKIQDVMKQILQNMESDNDIIWCALILAQHVKPSPPDLSNILVSLFKQLSDKLIHSDIQSEARLATSRMALQTLFILEKKNCKKILKSCVKPAFLQQMLRNHSSDVNALFLIDILLCCDTSFIKSFTSNSDLIQLLHLNLSSHNSLIRKLSLRILCGIHGPESIFHSCLRTEEVSATVHDFRTKTLHLSKLKHSDDMDDAMACAVLRFLVSNFYVNFSSYWPCVQEAVASFMPGKRNDKLWSLLLELLKKSSDNSEESEWWMPSTSQDVGIQNDFSTQSLYLFHNYGLKVYHKTEMNTRIDYFNHRLLFWKTLSMIPYPAILESFNRTLIDLFFTYLENEHFMVDKLHAPSQNLSTNQGLSDAAKSGNSRKKDAIKTLEAFLNVFAHFNNPIACAETKRLKSVYEQLLTHDYTSIQLCALKCFLTFRDKNILKFKDSFMSLLDDDRIKDTMLSFNISEIKNDERNSVIPILLRLMYGRMTSKSGLGAHGKSEVHVRRSIILRYLSGLNEKEMESFIFLAIEPLHHYVNEKTLSKPLNDKTVIKTDPSKIVPLSRQHGVLNTLIEIIGKHANLLTKFMFDYILKLLLTLHYTYNSLLSQIDVYNTRDDNQTATVDKRFSPFLRSLSKLVHSAINNLVEIWPDEEVFSVEQIKSLFFVIVDPHLHKLKHECISQPNLLLQLFEKISHQPKFVPLLAQKRQGSDNSEHQEKTPIEAIIAVLCSEKTSSSVCRFIMDIILRLVVIDVEDSELEEKNELVHLTLNNVNLGISLEKTPDVSKIGLLIVVHYIPEIMGYFIKKMKDKRKCFAVIQTQMKVLGALGDYITDKESSFQLAQLLLNNISGMMKLGSMKKEKVDSNEKAIIPALTILRTVAWHTEFIPSVARLFSRLKSRQCRELLCDVLDKTCIGSDFDALKRCTKIVRNLNAWDKKFVEELNYDARLIAFQELNEWLDSKSAAVLLQDDCIALLPLLHSSLFTLFQHCKDISLRESSSRALELIITLVLNNMSGDYTSCYHTIINGIILPGIQIGMNSSEETQRHECLRLLVKLVKLSPKANSLSELIVLCNETDPDADFFENVRHIQLHRRTRAFRKLAQLILSSTNVMRNNAEKSTEQRETSISYKNVFNYLLPLAMQTLKGQDLSKHLHLRDACLEVVTNSALIMPWSSYLKLLLQSMATITKHSFGIRIVCAILEAFHFKIDSVSESQAKDIGSGYCKNVNKVDENENFESDEHESSKTGNQSELISTIYRSIICNILPRLYSSLSGKLESDSEHKLASSAHYSDIETCNMRAPLAIAIASLLRKLPGFVMRSNLPQVILKMNVFLRHRYFEIRTVASKTVVEIAKLLGPDHLHVILQELKSGLARGYQKHVLVHVVSCILDKMEADLKSGDLQKSLNLCMNLASDDLFGDNEAERGVEKIQSKTPEARGRSKAYIIYKITSKFASKKSLVSIISRLKNILDTTHDHKKRRIVESVLAEISHGLQENSELAAEDIMVFLHGLLTENMPNLFKLEESRKNESSNVKKTGLRPESCYLLSTEPERYGVKQTKKTQKTNLHLIIEFALQFLNTSIKRQVILITNQEHLQMLDPFVSILKQCLSSAHSKTITESIRCLTKLFRTSLPSLEQHSMEIGKMLFTILREHSRGSVNDEIAAVTFKALSVYCISDFGAKLSDTQLQVLLAYSEEVLYEKHRQSHAFNLIRSILSRGLKCDEIMDIMKKIRDICIQSHDHASMLQARQVYIYFIMNYPMTKSKLSDQIEFILAQLSYEYETGRLSALELLASLINSFTIGMLKSNSGTIFLHTATVLVNDESMKCRKLSSHAIKMLLSKLPVDERDQLFSYVLHWLQEDSPPLHKQLAAMLVTIFIELQEMDFHRHLQKLLPLVLNVLSSTVEDQEESTGDVRQTDHLIFHQLSAVQSIIQHCKLAHNPTFDDELTSLLTVTENFLLHPHTWVRIVSSQIFGSLFGSWQPVDLVSMFLKKKQVKQCKYLTSELNVRMKDLSIKFCKQIQSPTLDSKLAEQCVKNLLFVVKVQYSLQHKETEMKNKKKPVVKMAKKSYLTNGSKELPPEASGVKKDGITHLLHLLSRTAKREAAFSIKETNKRTAVLKFCAAVCVSLEDVSPYLHLIIDPVYREIERNIVSEDKTANELKTLAVEALEVIKSKVSSDLFTKTYAAVGKRVIGHRRERKRRRDVELVADPVRAAAAKTRRQLKKKEQRKRKIASFRPEYAKGLKRKKKSSI